MNFKNIEGQVAQIVLSRFVPGNRTLVILMKLV